MIIYPDNHPKARPQRRIFYIDVGKLPHQRAQEYLEFVKREMRKQRNDHNLS